MKAYNLWLRYILKEWLLLVSAAGLILTSVYFKRLPAYSIPEIQVIFILFVLFVAVKGLQHSGMLTLLAQRIESGRLIPLKLVIATFGLSMVMTNDVALIVIVPLTLLLKVDRKDLLVILEALSANAGSASMPWGNPQNLFIYWYYGIRPEKFIASIAPLPSAFLILLIAASLFIKTKNIGGTPQKKEKANYTAYIYGSLLILLILMVLRLVPLPAGVLVILFALVFDRRSLRVDYALLLSFLCLFGLAQNLKIVLSSSPLEHSGHVFLFSALSSQIISNVPAALVFAKFTAHWKALLWGTNVGGFGSLMGSLANLIAYKLYISHTDASRPASFTVRFLFLGYGAFIIGIGLYAGADWIH